MKRISLISIIALVLVAVLCVALVSCKEDPKKPVIPEEIVNAVVDETYTDLYVDLYQFAELLATGTGQGQVEDQMDTYYTGKYLDEMGYIDVYAGPYDNNSVGTKMGDDEEDLKKDVKTVNVSYSDTDETTSADFTLTCTVTYQEKPATFTAEGNFTLGDSKKTIVFTSITFNDVKYDPDDFNKKMENRFKN